MKIKSKLLPLCAVIALLISAQSFTKNNTEDNQDKPQVKPSKPNIVIIMSDDLDSRQLSCYGGKNLQTTNIDALAAEGMKFQQTMCSEAMCVPTRASLFTGLYPMRHGSFQNHKPVYDTGLQSICQYLKAQDYRVALTGKDHSTKPQSVFPFEIVKGFQKDCVSPNDDYQLDSIRSYITRKNADPFCLFIMSINPHAPWVSGDASEFDPDKVILPAHMVDTKSVRAIYCKYLAEVRRLDNQVGDVRKLLKETGQDENTIFIFLGEQGPQFPGGKWTLYDNGLRSSMIVKWPGKVKANVTTDAIVQYEDITPTLVDIAGGKAIKDLDGRSFLNVLTGKSNSHRTEAFGIHNNIPEGTPYPMRSVRDQRYKLVMNLLSDQPYYIKYMMNPANKNSYWNEWVSLSDSSAKVKYLVDRITTRPRVELYDLQKDPDELNNIAGDGKNEQLVNGYETKLKKWMEQQGDEGAAVDHVYPKKNRNQR
ncbi:heparan N-sulfatase [Pedobacter sp. BAL39]|uniref:sulfatase family protein n=1 Tax=Pedobacter sp. BAL39 TaxID=391596 RepID=UPI000155A157|nr:sulfatase [Pedobacter sp. BAL39]EDM35344.1 heparan N-sulfatase [Pedobacter sp. BAL39]